MKLRSKPTRWPQLLAFTKGSKTFWGLLALLVLLLSLGMAVTQVYREGRKQELNRALVAAVDEGKTATAIYLLSEGADPNSRYLPMDTHPFWEQFWDRLRGVPLSPPADPEPTPTVLEMACIQNDLALMKVLLDAGASAKVANESRNPLLIPAVVTPNPEIVKLLLERGAYVDAHDNDELTALYYAARENNLPILQMLISHGAHVNVKDDHGWTPLHDATFSGNSAIVRLLLAHGGDVNARNTDGDTPLDEAVAYNRTECVKLLLANGAQVNTQDNIGVTPLIWAQRNHNALLVNLLKQAGAKR